MPSPIPNKKTDSASSGINFYQALELVANGKKVTKIEWGNKDIYGYLKDGILTLHKENEKDYHWLVSDGDLAGIDYIELA